MFLLKVENVSLSAAACFCVVVLNGSGRESEKTVSGVSGLVLAAEPGAREAETDRGTRDISLSPQRTQSNKRHLKTTLNTKKHTKVYEYVRERR